MSTSTQPRLDGPTSAAIEEELERILASRFFTKAQRMSKFLRVVVETSVGGSPGGLKEYSLGLSVFERQASFDPRLDPVVRNEARRLRQKLQLYCESDGKTNPTRISLPKGGYAPVFKFAAQSAIAPRNDLPAPDLQSSRPANSRPRQPASAKWRPNSLVPAALTVIATGLLVWVCFDRLASAPLTAIGRTSGRMPRGEPGALTSSRSITRKKRWPS